MRDRFGTVAALLGLMALMGALIFSRVDSSNLKRDLTDAKTKAVTALEVTDELREQVEDLRGAIVAFTLTLGEATYTCTDPQGDGSYACVAI